jgi:hypothetical protein
LGSGSTLAEVWAKAGIVIHAKHENRATAMECCAEHRFIRMTFEDETVMAILEQRAMMIGHRSGLKRFEDRLVSSSFSLTP